MKLNKEQQNIALQKLQYFLSVSCGSCNSHEWLLNDTIFELEEFQGKNRVLGSSFAIFPVLAVSCKSCGNTHFFNTILLGIIKKEDGENG